MFSRNILFFVVIVVEVNSSLFDEQLHESVLDPELCGQQTALLINDSLGLQFLDSSGKFPTGFFSGNLYDLGDYQQCLRTKGTIEEHIIEGKYCLVVVPVEELLGNLPTNGRSIIGEADSLRSLTNFRRNTKSFVMMSNEPNDKQLGRMAGTGMTFGLTLGLCVPKVCSAQEALDFLAANLTMFNITATERYCRLPNDKPLVTVDYVAIGVFSLIGLLTLISTSYDLHYEFVRKKNGAKASPALRSFSLYTNTRRFLSFSPAAGSLQCVDGIRAVSMMWVIAGHCFAFSMFGPIHNMLYVSEWLTSFSSIWIISAPYTVDTFFLLSGILCVYSTVGKVSRTQFIKKLHLFYLNRLLRMFPLLAASVLLHASLVNHLSDGPLWGNLAFVVDSCRERWWRALLHIQNYYDGTAFCIPQSWYLSVDVQLYAASPLALLPLFGRRRGARAALGLALLLALVGSTSYSFYYNFPSVMVRASRVNQMMEYMQQYYVNTLARAPPFCVGLAVGYELLTLRKRQLRINRRTNLSLWAVSLLTMSAVIFGTYPAAQADFALQGWDNFVNAYMRALWAAAVGWVVFACAQGNGGPVNWLLSLRLWRLPARLSYCMYLTHDLVIAVANASWLKSRHFTVGDVMYRFTSDLCLTALASLALCILIDAPATTLQKMLFSAGKKANKSESQNNITEDVAPTAPPLDAIDFDNKQEKNV